VLRGGTFGVAGIRYAVPPPYEIASGEHDLKTAICMQDAENDCDL
jgi:hypothetical protein